MSSSQSCFATKKVWTKTFWVDMSDMDVHTYIKVWGIQTQNVGEHFLFLAYLNSHQNQPYQTLAINFLTTQKPIYHCLAGCVFQSFFVENILESVCMVLLGHVFSCMLVYKSLQKPLCVCGIQTGVMSASWFLKKGHFLADLTLRLSH